MKPLRLSPAAFYDGPTLLTSLNVVKNFVLLGDVHASVQFVSFTGKLGDVHAGVQFVSYTDKLATCFVHRHRRGLRAGSCLPSPARQAASQLPITRSPLPQRRAASCACCPRTLTDATSRAASS